MGEMLLARCICGYESRPYAGSGMVQGPEYAPALCRHCRELVSVPVKPGSGCPRCGAPTEPLCKGSRGKWDGQRYEFPRCGKPTLRLSFAGVWDWGAPIPPYTTGGHWQIIGAVANAPLG